MNPIDREPFLLWIDKEHSPELNMALDEELISEAFNQKTCILRFYGWDRKSLSIGYVQSFSETYKEGYSLVRRPTGGGVVFHDIDLTYTVTIPSGHKIEKLPREESYSVIHKAITKALASMGVNSELAINTLAQKERSNMQCFIAPVRFDIVSANSKIAGAAQRRTKMGILHQGSIVLDNMASKINLLIGCIVKAFESELNARFEEFKPDKCFFAKAQKLAEEKYSTDAWNKMR